MFEIRLVLTEANVAQAEKMLSSEAPLIEDATEENKYHFYHNMGSLYIYKWDFKTALQYYLKARSFESYVFKTDVALNINLAFCYSMLGKYALAIGTIEDIYDLMDYNNTSFMQAYVKNMLAINYVRIGQLTRAKKLLDDCVLEGQDIHSKIVNGNILHNHGCACKKSKDYQKAINYFDQANEYYDQGDKFYIENMYWKIYCLIELKEASKARVLLSEMKTYAEGNTHYSLIFESLSHLLTISDSASIEFIEKKTIPYLVEKYEYYRALDYCELLENKFTKWGKGYKRRLLELTVIMHKMTSKMMFGEEMIFDEEKTYGNHIDSNDGNEF